MIGSAGSSEGTRRRPGLPHSGGRPGRTSDVDEETKSDAGRRNPSGRKGSGGGEEWGCAGGVVERETCSDKGWLFPNRHYIIYLRIKHYEEASLPTTQTVIKAHWHPMC